MRRRMPPDIWRKRAVNWLSLIVLAGVLSALTHYLWERLAEAESMAVQVALNNIRSQLVIEQNTARAQLRSNDLARYAGGNPMDWVEGTESGSYSIDWEEQVPASYIGDCSQYAGGFGVWCFDGERGELRYHERFGLGQRFAPALVRDGVYAWRVVVSEQERLSLMSVGQASSR